MLAQFTSTLCKFALIFFYPSVSFKCRCDEYTIWNLENGKYHHFNNCQFRLCWRPLHLDYLKNTIATNRATMERRLLCIVRILKIIVSQFSIRKINAKSFVCLNTNILFRCYVCKSNNSKSKLLVICWIFLCHWQKERTDQRENRFANVWLKNTFNLDRIGLRCVALSIFVSRDG